MGLANSVPLDVADMGLQDGPFSDQAVAVATSPLVYLKRAAAHSERGSAVHDGFRAMALLKAGGARAAPPRADGLLGLRAVASSKARDMAPALVVIEHVSTSLGPLFH
jgi:hypothetical protein